ncbi:ribonuclease-like [Mauremys reevesii]|uniref:ribonuclease-like n=1 Tax=Mauremys reevesii TaxID=260615 RepID=UPI00193F33B5|nr:ribonuclease-like [Mauremys reevesii]
MALRGRRPAFLLPLVLLAAGLALASGLPWFELNKIFNKHHVDYPRTTSPNPSTYCNMMMRARGIYWTPVNTFIHASTPSIRNVCFRGGIPIQHGLRRSIQSFSITTCRYIAWIRSYIGTRRSQNIIIGCWNWLPVYYRE